MDIDKLVTKEASSVQDWVNIQVMFRFLEGHIKMMINKETRKPSHFKAKLEKQRKKKEDEDIEEEKKMSEDSSFGRMQRANNSDMEEEKIAMDEKYVDQEPMQK